MPLTVIDAVDDALLERLDLRLELGRNRRLEVVVGREADAARLERADDDAARERAVHAPP